MTNDAVKVALYCRVSTLSQTTENQLRELTEVAARSGWQIVGTYCDEGISGAKGRNDRPQYDQLIKDAHRRKFDLIACWSIDRLGRSIQTLVEFMNEINALGIELYFHQQAINTKTPSGRMVFGIFSALAGYEREMIRERVKSGLARAKANGTKLGRPSKLNESVRSAAACLYQRGMSVRKIAAELGIGIGTVYSCLPKVTAKAA